MHLLEWIFKVTFNVNSVLKLNILSPSKKPKFTYTIGQLLITVKTYLPRKHRVCFIITVFYVSGHLNQVFDYSRNLDFLLGKSEPSVLKMP